MTASPIATLVAETGRYLASLDGPGMPQVLAGFELWKTGAVRAVSAQPNAVVAAHLTSALRQVTDPMLASAIEAAAPHLHWITYDRYDRALIGEAFAEGHAFATIVGESGPVAAMGFELGLFLIAPGVFYRDHNHAAPELYAPLTGPHGWRFAPGDPLDWTPAHTPVWNEPFRPHAIKVGTAPFLCIFVWTAEVNEPASVIPAGDWAEIEA